MYLRRLQIQREIGGQRKTGGGVESVQIAQTLVERRRHVQRRVEGGEADGGVRVRAQSERRHVTHFRTGRSRRRSRRRADGRLALPAGTGDGTAARRRSGMIVRCRRRRVVGGHGGGVGTGENGRPIHDVVVVAAVGRRGGRRRRQQGQHGRCGGLVTQIQHGTRTL